jgi:hypothetical protein
MSLKRVVPAVAMSVLLGGCSTDLAQFASRWLEAEEAEVTDSAFALLETGEWEALRGAFHASVTDPGSDDVFDTIAGILESASLDDRHLIGLNVNVTNGRRSSVLTYEGTTSDGWYVATVRLLDGELYGLNVARTEQSMVAANVFGLRTVGLSHLVLLLLGLASIGAASFASYRVLNSNVSRRRLWAVLPWVMVGGITLNWTTGAVGVQLLKLHLPPITVLKGGPAAPWMFGFGFPLFAVLALRKVRRASEASAARPDEGDLVA